MDLERLSTNLEALLARRRNAKMFDALQQIRAMVNTSQGSEQLVCMALRKYVDEVLRDVTPKGHANGKTDAGDANEM